MERVALIFSLLLAGCGGYSQVKITNSGTVGSIQWDCRRAGAQYECALRGIVDPAMATDSSVLHVPLPYIPQCDRKHEIVVVDDEHLIITCAVAESPLQSFGE